MFGITVYVIREIRKKLKNNSNFKQNVYKKVTF